MDSVIDDIRFFGRRLVKRPIIGGAALCVLALSIGANTAIFSIVNAVILRPLPYPEPDRIVQLMTASPQGPNPIVSIPEFVKWRDQVRVFEDLAAYDFSGPGLNLRVRDGRPELVRSIHVSRDYFRLFGAAMISGRTFSIDEDSPGGARVVVITAQLAEQKFGKEDELVGQAVSVSGQPYIVIGVLQSGFTPQPAQADIFMPLQADPNSLNQSNFIEVAGRLRSGVSLSAAKAGLAVAAEEFRRQYPAFLAQTQGFTAQPLRERLIGDARPALLLLSGAAGFVLLIACANLATLLLAQAVGRRREIAIRAALGATRNRIVRQLLTESLALSLLGGGLGLAVGVLGVRVPLAISSGNLPRIGRVGETIIIDWRVLAFTLGISLVTGIVFGAGPAVTAGGEKTGGSTKENTARSGSSVGQNRAFNLLLIAEIALALVLLVGAGLLIRTYAALHRVDPGFDMNNVLSTQTPLTGTQFDHTSNLARLAQESIRRIEALPGVESAATTCSLPLEATPILPVTIEGRPLADGPYHGGARWRSVSPHYFGVFKIVLIEGRLFSDDDNTSSPGVVIINQTMAKKLWSGQYPVGQRITIGKGIGPEFEDQPRQIVGIVSDARDIALRSPADSEMYIPVAQVPDRLTELNNRIVPLTWVIRASTSPSAILEEADRDIQAIDGDLALANGRTMDAVREQSVAENDLDAVLLTAFAVVALALTGFGIYGTMAYSVQHRLQEVGIRIALGATPRSVRALIALRGIRLTVVGLLLGIASGIVLMRLLASLLYGVRTFDLLAFLCATGLLGGVSLLANYLPARRAMGLHPMEVLRIE